MLKKSSKLLGLAAIVAAGIQISSFGVAWAGPVPAASTPELPIVAETDALVQPAHARGYRHAHRRYSRPRYRYRGPRYRRRGYRGPRYRHRRPGYRYRHNGWWYSTPWFLPPYVGPGRSYNRRSHVNWCLSRYRSYNPRTNRFLGYNGVYQICRSPYSR